MLTPSVHVLLLGRSLVIRILKYDTVSVSEIRHGHILLTICMYSSLNLAHRQTFLSVYLIFNLVQRQMSLTIYIYI